MNDNYYLQLLRRIDAGEYVSSEQKYKLSLVKSLKWKLIDEYTLPKSMRLLCNLTKLDLSGCEKLSDINVLSELVALTTLDLSECRKLSDISALSGLTALSSLNLSWCESLTDISALSDLTALTYLDLSGCENLSDISALSELTTLIVLDLSGCESLSNIGALSGLTALSSLYLSECDNLSDISALSELTALSLLDISWCGSVSDISALSGLTALTSLNLSWYGNLSNISALSGLTALTSLDLSECRKLSDISALSGLTALSSLNLSWCESLTDISALSDLTALTSLNLSICKNLSDISALSRLTALTSLDLSWCGKLSNISALFGLTALTSLNLSECRKLSDISALSGLTALSSLNLSWCEKLSDISALSGLTALSSLNLSWCKNLSDIKALSGLTSLTSLDLSRCVSLSDISALSGLTALTSLNLSDTDVIDISALSGMSGLTDLDLRATRVRDISALSSLQNLTKLDLRQLEITSLPMFLLDLQLDFLSEKSPSGPGIYIYGLKLTEQPIEIFSQSRDLIRDYFISLNKVALNECKVIFIGDAEAGKTHSIRRLLNHGAYLINYDDKSTPGIEISVNRTKIDDSDITVNYWDFGGQEIQRSMHRMFLTRRTVYVVFLNARQDPIDERAVFWLENIKSYAPEAPVIIVINKIDQNKLPKVNDTGLIETYGNQIKRIVRMSALVDEPNLFMDELQGSIVDVIKELPTVKELVPQSWKLLMEDVREIPEHYLSAAKFKDRCRKQKIDDYKTIHDDLVNLFQDIGISFCYYEDRSLSNYFILDPKWLVNAIYAYISNSDIVAENGKIKRNDLYDLLTENTLNGKPIKREYPNMKYEIHDVNYILGLTRRFYISYPIGDGSEFFPLLCDGNAKQSVKNTVSENALHFIFRYRFLPETVMHRLIIKMKDDIDYRYVWYRGGIFRQTDSKQTAYIYTLGNELHVYVDSESSFYDPNEYMTPIMSNIHHINEVLKISAEELVTYRKNGIEAELSLKYVRGNIKNGIYWVYDPQINEAIDLRNVIKRYDSIQSKMRVNLLTKIISALKDLQNKVIFYNANENARNAHVSSLLRAAGIPCCDQQTGGVSSTGIEPGERDIVIQDKNQQDVLIYEGMNLNYMQTTIIDNHLKRLMDNYNPHGLPYGILTTYLKCKDSSFNSFIDKYLDYITKNAPKNYICNGKPDEIDIHGYYLRCFEMSYSKDGNFFIIYHIIVLLGA